MVKCEDGVDSVKGKYMYEVSMRAVRRKGGVVVTGGFVLAVRYCY